MNDFKNIKYFSHLRPLQKDRTINYLRIFINRLDNLSYNFALEILKNNDFEKSIQEIDFINKKLKAQKVFYYKKINCYMPLNFKEIININISLTENKE